MKIKLGLCDVKRKTAARVTALYAAANKNNTTTWFMFNLKP